jgi:dTDP-4-amino-4,6-dideoxygalactose transaminase
MDADKLEAAITERTKAILPVHYTGNVADMPRIKEIADKHGLKIVEDACQSIGGERDGKKVGSWGSAAGFSLHPLKNLNVWGDGGIIVTDDDDLAEHLRLLRNHGLVGRDEVEIFGHNSRLDSLQAVIGNRLIGETSFITNRRIENAARLDEALSQIDGIQVPTRESNVKHVYHLYIVRADRRDDLRAHLTENGVEAKIHYPVPVHLQPASRDLPYKEGDFPVAEEDSHISITLPAHQHLTDDEVDYMIEQVRSFYSS